MALAEELQGPGWWTDRTCPLAALMGWSEVKLDVVDWPRDKFRRRAGFSAPTDLTTSTTYYGRASSRQLHSPVHIRTVSVRAQAPSDGIQFTASNHGSLKTQDSRSDSSMAIKVPRASRRHEALGHGSEPISGSLAFPKRGR